MFEIIAKSGAFTEGEARYYFKQLIEGLNYCHMRNVAHRDLKPENLLINQNFDLKIVDFGFAAPRDGRDQLGFLQTKLGTLNYMAPEMHLEAPYEGSQIDLFAAGMILFIMVSQHPPFLEAKTTDPFYKMIAGHRPDLFWSRHEESGATFSEELKDLLTRMFQVEPEHRPSMSEIMSHPWILKPLLSKAQIIKSFTVRDKIVKQAYTKEKEKKAMMKERLISERRQSKRKMDTIRRILSLENQSMAQVQRITSAKPKHNS